MGAPVRFQKAVSRSKENAAVRRRKACRSASCDRPFPSAEGTGPTARRPPGAAIAPAPVGASPPSDWGDIPPQRPGAPSPGTMEHGFMKSDEHQACGMRAFSTGQLATSLSCPAKAGHPVMMVWRLLDRPLSRVMTAENRSSGGHFGETNPRSSARLTAPSKTYAATGCRSGSGAIRPSATSSSQNSRASSRAASAA